VQIFSESGKLSGCLNREVCGPSLVVGNARGCGYNFGPFLLLIGTKFREGSAHAFHVDVDHGSDVQGEKLLNG